MSLILESGFLLPRGSTRFTDKIPFSKYVVMATGKFKTSSPFEGLGDRHHHPTDFKYQQYLDGQCNDGKEVKTAKVVKMALFGIGRAGSIHMTNLKGNSRVELAYVVEADKSKWELAREKWNLGKDTKLLHPDVRMQHCL